MIKKNKIPFILLDMKTFLILFIFIVNPLYAVEDSYFFHDLNQTSDEKTYDYDLKTLNQIKNDKKDIVKEYNNKNYMHLMFGMDYEEFEEKDSFYKKTLNPSFSLEFNRKFLTKLDASFYFRTSTNNMILKQNLFYKLVNFYDFEINTMIQVGQKIALTEQKNSGYFFSNLGVNLKYSLGKLYFHIDYLKNYSSFEFESISTRILYDFEKDQKIGIYFGLENYLPVDYEYDREGQRSVRGGFLYFY